MRPFSLSSLFIAVARHFSDLPIALGHGVSIDFLEAAVAAQVRPNIYIELSSLMPHHCAELLTHVDASRLMAGFDLPESLETEFGRLFTLELTPESRRAILWDTPCRVFGL
ncbi:MAG: amidohydrolase family protein [Acidobacteriota bacterium]